MNGLFFSFFKLTVIFIFIFFPFSSHSCLLSLPSPADYLPVCPLQQQQSHVAPSFFLKGVTGVARPLSPT